MAKKKLSMRAFRIRYQVFYRNYDCLLNMDVFVNGDARKAIKKVEQKHRKYEIAILDVVEKACEG